MTRSTPANQPLPLKCHRGLSNSSGRLWLSPAGGPQGKRGHALCSRLPGLLAAPQTRVHPLVFPASPGCTGFLPGTPSSPWTLDQTELSAGCSGRWPSLSAVPLSPASCESGHLRGPIAPCARPLQLISCCLLPGRLYPRMEAFVGIFMFLASRMVIHMEKEVNVYFNRWMNEQPQSPR